MDPTVIVIPTYNERECLPTIVPAVRAAVPAATVLIVDDNSPDGTGALADEMAAADPQVQVLHRAGKEGLGAAYLRGVRARARRRAGWQRIVQMDADFSHDPADVPRLLAALDAGADLAVGSRYVSRRRHRELGPWPAHHQPRRRPVRAHHAGRGRAATSRPGSRPGRRATLRGIDLGAVRARGYGFQIEMTYRAVQQRLPRRRGPDQVRRPPGRVSRRCRARSSSRR